MQIFSFITDMGLCLSLLLLQVNDQLLVQPQAVLLSMVRALHVIRGVLQEVCDLQFGYANQIQTQAYVSGLVSARDCSTQEDSICHPPQPQQLLAHMPCGVNNINLLYCCIRLTPSSC
jgi:hypothetical protein